MLTKLYTLMADNHGNLIYLRTFTILLLSFAGFLRFDECVNLTLDDIVFENSYIAIILRKSKTDAFRDGDRVLISETHSNLCPVACLKHYINFCKIADKSEFLFRAVQWSKKYSCYTLRNSNKPISYSTVL